MKIHSDYFYEIFYARIGMNEYIKMPQQILYCISNNRFISTQIHIAR